MGQFGSQWQEEEEEHMHVSNKHIFATLAQDVTASAIITATGTTIATTATTINTTSKATKKNKIKKSSTSKATVRNTKNTITSVPVTL